MHWQRDMVTLMLWLVPLTAWGGDLSQQEPARAMCHGYLAGTILYTWSRAPVGPGATVLRTYGSRPSSSPKASIY
jgi:hypothetical protein